MPDQATIAAGLYAFALALLVYRAVRFHVLGPAPDGPGKEWL